TSEQVMTYFSTVKITCFFVANFGNSWLLPAICASNQAIFPRRKSNPGLFRGSQGVWFRYFVQQQAQPLDVTGYARNLPDGRVEVLLCGSDKAVASVQKSVSQGPPNARVDDVQWQHIDAELPNDFKIL
ncbi:MAG: acylphosphatase, partial [Porticoccaceae bacterium]|nr:acylphosphatase [Porticoccaceae bacterium]